MGSTYVISWRAFLPMVLLGVFFAYATFEIFSTNLAEMSIACLPFAFIMKDRKNILLSTILLVMAFSFFLDNTILCGNAGPDGPIPLIQDAATQAALESMTDAELDAFARHIGYPIRRTANGWEAVDYYHGLHTDTPQAFNYQALLYWLAGTAILFIITHWGTDVKDFLFSLPSRAATQGFEMYEGLTNTMRLIGREREFRQGIFNYAGQLLQDPEKAYIVNEAIAIYLRGRGMQALSIICLILPLSTELCQETFELFSTNLVEISTASLPFAFSMKNRKNILLILVLYFVINNTELCLEIIPDSFLAFFPLFILKNRIFKYYTKNPFIFSLTIFNFFLFLKTILEYNIYIYFVLFISISVLIYLIIYSYNNFEKSIKSFIAFWLNLVIGYFYILGFIVLIKGIPEPRYLENISVLSQYRYLLLSILSIMFIIIYLAYPQLISILSFPYLKEEIKRFLYLKQNQIFGPLFSYILDKLNHLYYQKIYIIIHSFLFYFLRIINLFFFINFIFFGGDLRYCLYMLPISFFIWLLSFINYYFDSFFENESHYIRCLVHVTPLSPLKPEKNGIIYTNTQNFSFQLTPFAYKEGYTNGISILADLWFEYGRLDVFFRQYKKKIKIVSLTITILQVFCWLMLTFIFFFQPHFKEYIISSPIIQLLSVLILFFSFLAIIIRKNPLIVSTLYSFSLMILVLLLTSFNTSSECMEAAAGGDNQPPEQPLTPLQKGAVDAIVQGNEELTRTLMSLIRQLETEEQLRAFLQFVHNMRTENAIVVDNTGHVQNAGNTPYDRLIAYLLAGLGVIVIGVIFWTHRDIFMDFAYNVTHGTFDVMRRAALKAPEGATTPQLIRMIEFFSKVPSRQA